MLPYIISLLQLLHYTTTTTLTIYTYTHYQPSYLTL